MACLAVSVAWWHSCRAGAHFAGFTAAGRLDRHYDRWYQPVVAQRTRRRHQRRCARRHLVRTWRLFYRPSVTSTGNSQGTFAGGGTVSGFDGFWALNLGFNLPSNANNVQLSFDNLFADDRAVLEVNGTIVGNYSIGGTTGFMTFTDGGPNASFTFNGPTSGLIASGFNLGGTNTLALIVNNTGGGAFGSLKDVGPNDYTAAFVEGSLSYDLGGSAAPEPATAVLAAGGLLAIQAVLLRRRSRAA
jgi:hypothetical protein